ncbi:MAG: hypothetical protein V1803_00055 [Candidatus Roizmanbacteria bacterium]
MKPEIPFSFLRDVKGNPWEYADRQSLNRLLRQRKIPIDISGLDVLISLWKRPSNSCRFKGLFDDMITLPKVNPIFDRTRDEQAVIQRRHLRSILSYLRRHKIVRIDDQKRYRLTKQGKTIMKEARQVFTS